MKFLYLRKIVVGLLLPTSLSLTSSAQEPVPLRDVLNYTGQTVSVCGKVYSVSLLKNVRSTPTLMNVGGSRPGERITIRIRFESRGNFEYNPEELFLNKNICFEGTITKVHGYPEIVLDSSNRDRLVYEASRAKSDTTNGSDSTNESIVRTKYKKIIHQISVNAYVLAGPDLSQPIITFLKAGSIVSVRYVENGWSYVKIEKDITKTELNTPVYGFVRNLSIGLNNKGEILQKGGKYTLLGNLFNKKLKGLR